MLFSYLTAEILKHYIRANFLMRSVVLRKNPLYLHGVFYILVLWMWRHSIYSYAWPPPISLHRILTECPLYLQGAFAFTQGRILTLQDPIDISVYGGHFTAGIVISDY
jgi:hypothetical protein